MEELTKIMETATANIEAEYFFINIDGGDSVYRERVYCYELYHQMRTHWPKNTLYILNGELDKTAHPLLSKLGVKYQKPDLLVHKSGSMKYNHAIIEVKPSNTPKKGIVKDLSTLSLFVNQVGYERAIYLIYGFRAFPHTVKRIQQIASEAKDMAPIEIWIHSEIQQPAWFYTTLE